MVAPNLIASARRAPHVIEQLIQPLSFADAPNKGSTDVGDISWFVPTCGLRVARFAADSPGHSWQNVACIGSSIGEKGTMTAAKVLAASALDLLEKPDILTAARRPRQANGIEEVHLAHSEETEGTSKNSLTNLDRRAETSPRTTPRATKSIEAFLAPSRLRLLNKDHFPGTS